MRNIAGIAPILLLEMLDAIDNINVDRWEEGFVIVRLKPGENVEDGLLLKTVHRFNASLRRARQRALSIIPNASGSSVEWPARTQC